MMTRDKYLEQVTEDDEIPSLINELQYDLYVAQYMLNAKVGGRNLYQRDQRLFDYYAGRKDSLQVALSVLYAHLNQ